MENQTFIFVPLCKMAKIKNDMMIKVDGYICKGEATLPV